MSKDFADWYQVAHLQADHEMLQKRRVGIEAFLKSVKLPAVYELSRSFLGLPSKDEDSLAQFESSMHEADSAFTFTNRATEVAVLAGAVLASAIEKNHSISIPAALAIVSGVLKGRRQPVIPDIVQAAVNYLNAQSVSLRNVDGVSTRTSEVAKDNIEAVVAAFNANTPNAAAEPWSKIINSQIAQIKTLNGQVSLLDRRYALLREESDMLWWLTGEHCRTMDLSFSDVPPAAAPFCIGKELASLTRVIPGPVAVHAFSSRMLSASLKDAGKAISLAAGVNGVDRAIRENWAAPVRNHGAIDLCPVHFAIIQSLTVEGPKDWFATFKAAQRMEASLKMAPVEIAHQTFIESLLLR